jgi:UDP-GlcNAc:undecaprenyl-phosphate GlcNAc-1-phosphate transferase
MKQLLWAGVQSFACSVVLTPIVRDIFRSYKVVDEPDQNRKVHKYPIPRVGGIGIAAAYAIAYFLMRPTEGESLSREMSLMENLLPAALVVFLTGIIDDFFGLKPWQKLLGQLTGAGIACWAGVVIQSAGGVTFPFYVGVPVTIFWLLLCSNAINLVDGLDGLAAGVGFVATLTMFAAAVIQGNQPLAFATLPLAGALLGFLCFNFNPATVFLGDSGSLLIGFLLGCFGVIWTQKSVTLLGITAPLMTLCIPLLDVLLAIVRRWLRNQPIFSADRGHIHHRLLDRGLTTRQTVLMLYGFCGLCAIFSLTQSMVKDVLVSVLVVVLFIALAWVGVHYLGYGEFMLAGRLLRTGEFQRSVQAHLILRSFEEKLSTAETIADCWNVAVSMREQFGFLGMRLRAGGVTFEDWKGIPEGHGCWTAQITLSDTGDCLELVRPLGSTHLPIAAVPFLELLVSALTARLLPNATDQAKSILAMQSGN